MTSRAAATPGVTPSRIVVRAPNWLGDAVMGLPAMAAVRAAYPSARLQVAAIAAVAPLFHERTAVAPDDVVAVDKAEEARGAGESVTVGLTYDSPALGTLDLKLVLQPGGAGLQVTVGATAGAPEERVRGAAEELRRALGDATRLPAAVRVVGRTPKPRVDFYA